VTPASVAALGQRLWLRCNSCGRDRLEDPLAFAERHGLYAARTPLLSIAQRLRCTSCGAKKGHAWPEPHALGETSRD